ncbi:MAG TPA: MerR family transcriptional regulator [Ktedonobacteraceae bacterium]|nr:MerR family transcriptional regulator [Ktedonobacteraceae bacterium]
MYNIDELAHRSGIPSRTIRFYNTQGLLPPPHMRGRVAYYDDEHLAVLSTIKELKEKQHLPLETIKQMLEIRAQEGEVEMNLALKRRLLRPLNGNEEASLSKEALQSKTNVPLERIHELTEQGLLFPVEKDGELLYSGDDVLLLELYQRLERLGLPLALPALIRFQLRQLVRSEIAALEQHVRPRWQEEGLPLEQQAAQFEVFLTLADTLISVMHRRMLYHL